MLEPPTAPQSPADAAPKPLLSPAALALPLASGMGYAMALLYELGYAETFGIPRGIVTISLNDFLVGLFTSVSWIIVCWIWIAGAIAIGSRTRSVWSQLAWSSVALMLPVLSASFLAWTAGHPAFAIALLVGSSVVVPAVAFEELASKKHKAVMTWPMLVKFQEIRSLPIQALQKLFGRHAGTGLLVLAVSGIGVFFLGQSHARNPRSYLHVLEIPGYVVLRTYRNHVVLGAIPTKTNDIGETLRILEWSDLSDKTLIKKPRRQP